MIAEGFEREKRSFHVGVRRIRAFAAHGLVHVAAFLLVFSVALPLVGVRAQDGDGLPVPLDTDVAGQDEADAAMFLPWPNDVLQVPVARQYNLSLGKSIVGTGK